MNPAMLQYLQQLYGQRAMPGGVANMPAQNVPLGGQTNWIHPPQLADGSGMYGPTLSTLFGQAGATGAPNMVNAPAMSQPFQPAPGPMPQQPGMGFNRGYGGPSNVGMMQHRANNNMAMQRGSYMAGNRRNNQQMRASQQQQNRRQMMGQQMNLSEKGW